MPTYEYECEACGMRFERWQKMSETAIIQCPDCSGKVNRMISGGTGFILKSSDRDSQVDRSGGECSLEQTGRTCCGRNERCGKASCGGES
jgi:putative FmdB family regulatory protein